MDKKTIIVACASSMITSTVVSNNIRDIAKKNNIPEPKILQVKFSEINGVLKTNDVDFIVPTGNIDDKIKEKHLVISGMPFITGVGVDKVSKTILEELKK